jgi:hypothetical protein
MAASRADVKCHPHTPYTTTGSLSLAMFAFSFLAWPATALAPPPSISSPIIPPFPSAFHSSLTFDRPTVPVPVRQQLHPADCRDGRLDSILPQQPKDLPASITIQPSATSSSLSSATTLQLWKRRLVTHEDWMHVHKITGILFLLSSWGLSGYALCDFIAHGWTQPVTCHGKPFSVLLLVLLGSSVIHSFVCHSLGLLPPTRSTRYQ